MILGASGEYSNTAFSNSATVKLEGTVGYRAELGDRFSVTGSAGLGENIQASGSGDSFPYYVLRIGADVKATEDLTWNIITFRYRDGFDPDDNFLTPQVATGLSYDLDEHNSISGVAQYNWKDWEPDTVGLELGYNIGFSGRVAPGADHQSGGCPRGPERCFQVTTASTRSLLVYLLIEHLAG